MSCNSGRTSLLVFFLSICTTIRCASATVASNSIIVNYDKKVCANEPTCRLLSENEAVLTQRRRTLQGRDCMCDANCMEYQDCCKDAPSYVDDPSHLSVNSYYCPAYANVYMIDSCAPNYPEETIKQLCADGKQFQQGDTISIATPVTSLDTRATYVNQYCAACNRESDWQTWNITARCTEIPPRQNVVEPPPYVYQQSANSFHHSDQQTSESSYGDYYTPYSPGLESSTSDANRNHPRIPSSTGNTPLFLSSADTNSSPNLANRHSPSVFENNNDSQPPNADSGDFLNSQDCQVCASPPAAPDDAQSSISSTENSAPSANAVPVIKTSGPISIMQFFFNFFPVMQSTNGGHQAIDVHEGMTLNEPPSPPSPQSAPVGNSHSKKVDSPTSSFGIRIKIGRSKRQNRQSPSSKNDQIGRVARYDVGNDKFYAKHEGKEYVCSFRTSLPRQFENFVRRCIPNLISNCPREGGYESITCRSYTAIVYDKSTNRAYKNKDCALCNNVPLNKLTGCPLMSRVGGGGDNVSNASLKAKNNAGQGNSRIADSQGFNQARR